MTDSIRGFASRHGLTVDSIRGMGSRHPQVTDSIRGFESGHGWVNSSRGMASRHPLTVDSIRGAASGYWPKAFGDYFVANSPTAAAPSVIVRAYISDVGQPLPILRWKIRRSRSDLADWSIDLDNRDGYFSPGATDGPWAGKLDCDTHDGSFAIKRFVSFDISVGGQRWSKCPQLLIQDYTYKEDAGEIICTISGNCFADILFSEDQLMVDVDATSAVQGSNDVIKEILNQYGIGCVTEQESFVVLLLHRVGVPMDWIRQLAEVTQSWWLSSGSQLIFKVGGWRASTDWHLVDRHHLKMLSFRRTSRSEINSLVIQRAEATAGKAVESREDKGIGIVRRPLGFPIDRGQLHVSVQDGDFTDVYWLNKKGFVIASGVRYNGQDGPISDVQFTVLPNTILSTGGTDIIQSTAYERTFKWWVDGREQVTAPGFPPPSAYTVPVEDSAHIAATYRKKHREPITNELIPDASTALRYGQRAIAETLRGYNIAQVQLLLNPEIEPGHMVALTGTKAKLSSYRMLVDAVEHSGDSSSAVTTLDLSRPRIAS